MSKSNPWSSIETRKGNSLAAVRADETLKHDFFWARNSAGQYVFLYVSNVDVGMDIEIPRLSGIGAQYYPASKQLQLVLNDADDWELFLVLCEDLMRATNRHPAAGDVMKTVLVRLSQWQKFLSRKKQRILDEKAIRGLIGELIFLRDVLIPKYSAVSVGFWTGPDGAKQDFAVGDVLFEVKTYLAASSPKVVISSAEQLWSPIGKLYLVASRLSNIPASAKHGISLTRLITDLRQATEGTEWNEKFEEKILAAGYIDLPEYDQHKYEYSHSMLFEVRDGFPRFIPEVIPDGIDDVTYSIGLDKCMPFIAEPQWPEF